MLLRVIVYPTRLEVHDQCAFKIWRQRITTDSRVLVLRVRSRLGSCAAVSASRLAKYAAASASSYRMPISCMNITYTTRKVRLKYGARVVFLFDGFVSGPTTDYQLPTLECLCFFFVCWMELNLRSRLAVSCAAAAAAVMVGRDAASLTTELESRDQFSCISQSSSLQRHLIYNR